MSKEKVHTFAHEERLAMRQQAGSGQMARCRHTITAANISVQIDRLAPVSQAWGTSQSVSRHMPCCCCWGHGPKTQQVTCCTLPLCTWQCASKVHAQTTQEVGQCTPGVCSAAQLSSAATASPNGEMEQDGGAQPAA
jgi:hypothetical protein